MLDHLVFYGKNINLNLICCMLSVKLCSMMGHDNARVMFMLSAVQTRGADALRRRHVDGSFTSDVNKVLDSMAAKEYLQWVMGSQSSAR